MLSSHRAAARMALLNCSLLLPFVQPRQPQLAALHHNRKLCWGLDIMACKARLTQVLATTSCRLHHS